MDKEQIIKMILNSAFEVHKQLGPGLYEQVYKKCLEYELLSQGLNVETEKEISVDYKEISIDCGYRLDLIVENEIIVELKSVESLNDIHLSQIITYLKLSHKNIGLLINFNTKLLKDGIKRVIV